ncbi:MAG: hypothetical protein II130_00415 [Bacteroidales bacterium]|nr:hypothetical protein [Bacteroidales bacterium]
MRKVLFILAVAAIACGSAVSCQPVQKYDTPDSVALYTKSGPAVEKTAGTTGPLSISCSEAADMTGFTCMR